MSALMSTPALVVGVLLALLYGLYRAALPKPIPGIPYNKESANRLMGDLPHLMASKKAGEGSRAAFTGLGTKLGSPLTQFFVGPFAPPLVVLSDFREMQDLIVRRSRDLERGPTQRHAWGGIIPEHFIGMDDHDHRFKDAKSLTRDLMTPSFLHEVNAPESYQKVLNFIKLWRHKADIANGQTFDSMTDVGNLTFDIMTAAAFAVEDRDSETIQYCETLQSKPLPKSTSNNPNSLYVFPEAQVSELQSSYREIGQAASRSFSQPSQRLFHFFNNRTAIMRKTYASNRKIQQSYIDQSSKRLREEGPNFKPRSAVDYIVSREVTIAKKDGRAPVFDSPRVHDQLVGYMLGGFDSTHSTLSFIIKYFGQEQAAQQKLRKSLHQAYPDALANHEQPALQDMIKTQIPYLDAFIEEVLRMSSPARVISKGVSNDMEILGHFIPKGSTLLFNLLGPTYDRVGIPANEGLRSESSRKHRADGLGDWTASDFPAHEFWPERWLVSSSSSSSSSSISSSEDHQSGSDNNSNDNDNTFNSKAGPNLPFSAGTRGCWGKRLAYLQLKLVTTLLVWNFSFEQLPAELNDWDIEDDLFVKPKHCRVKLSSI